MSTERPAPDALAWLQLLDVLSGDLPSEPIVDALENLGPPPAELAPAIGAQLRAAQTEESAYWSATLLGRLGPAAIDQLPHLCEALAHSPHLAVRERSAWALGQLGPAATAALPALRHAAADPSPRLRRLAQAALEQIGPLV